MIFEGLWDFLSWLEMEKTAIPKYDVYVLNSVWLANEAVEAIEAIKSRTDEIASVMLYLDNDEAGRDITAYVIQQLEPLGLQLGMMAQVYINNKDLSEWWINK